MYDVRLYHTANDLNFNSMDLQILHSDASLESYDVRSFLFMPFIDFYIEPYEIDSNYTPSLPTIQLKAGERYELKYTVYPGWNHTPDYSIIRHDHTLNPDNYYGDSQIDCGHGYVKQRLRKLGTAVNITASYQYLKIHL